MKTIKYIILGIAIMSMSIGNFHFAFGQEDMVFCETYNSREITTFIHTDDLFFKMVNQDQTDPGSAILGTCPESESATLWAHLQSQAFLKSLPDDIRFAWGSDVHSGYKTLYALRLSDTPNAPLKQDIQTVTVQSSNREGSFDLLITFSGNGAEKWAEMTKKNTGKSIAIVLDGKVVAAPKVMTQINEGRCRISGDLSKDEALAMKAQLES